MEDRGGHRRRFEVERIAGGRLGREGEGGVGDDNKRRRRAAVAGASPEECYGTETVLTS